MLRYDFKLQKRNKHSRCQIHGFNSRQMKIWSRSNCEHGWSLCIFQTTPEWRLCQVRYRAGIQRWKSTPPLMTKIQNCFNITHKMFLKYLALNDISINFDWFISCNLLRYFQVHSLDPPPFFSKPLSPLLILMPFPLDQHGIYNQNEIFKNYNQFLNMYHPWTGLMNKTS